MDACPDAAGGGRSAIGFVLIRNHHDDDPARHPERRPCQQPVRHQRPGVGGTRLDAGLALTFLMVGAAMLLAVMATAVRFRRGAGIEREQIKWFVAANTATVILLLVVTVDPALDITWFDAVASPASRCPRLRSIAILRYRLYDIDRLIARTVSWALVTGSLVDRVRGSRRRPSGHPRRCHPGPDGGRRSVHARGLRPVPTPSTASPSSGRPAL